MFETKNLHTGLMHTVLKFHVKNLKGLQDVKFKAFVPSFGDIFCPTTALKMLNS